jgi:hypothetical protein
LPRGGRVGRDALLRGGVDVAMTFGEKLRELARGMPVAPQKKPKKT